MSFTNLDETTSKKPVTIPANEFITFNRLLRTHKVNMPYFKFIIPDRQGAPLYDKLELAFVKPNNKTVPAEMIEIDNKQYLYDENIFQ